MTFKDRNTFEIWQAVFEVCLGEQGDLGTTNARIVWVLVGWGLMNFKIEAGVAKAQRRGWIWSHIAPDSYWSCVPVGEYYFRSL